jgi:DNA-binding NtrC family response regulator
MGAARVLVAEDDAGMRELITATLEDAGYDVVVAREGTDAAALARRPEIGLLLLDVLLPRVSGDAIAEQIRHERPQLPIILMTGDYGTLFAAAAGPPILRKPFTPEQLLEAVQRALPPAKAVT